MISQPAPRRALAAVCALACLVLLAANALATPSDEDGRLEQVQADAQLATRLAQDAISFAAGGMLTDASQSLQSAKVALERASRGIAGREGPVATAVTGAHAAVGRASAAVERAGRRPGSRREVPAASKERAAERARTRAHTAEIAKLVRAAELGLGKATHLAQVVRETAADDRPTTVRGNVDRVAAAAAKVRAAAQGLAAMGADPGLIETSSQQAETAEAIVVSIGEHATRVLAERQAAHAQERTGWIASAVAEGLELTRSARARAAAAGSGPGQASAELRLAASMASTAAAQLDRARRHLDTLAGEGATDAQLEQSRAAIARLELAVREAAPLIPLAAGAAVLGEVARQVDRARTHMANAREAFGRGDAPHAESPALSVGQAARAARKALPGIAADGGSPEQVEAGDRLVAEAEDLAGEARLLITRIRVDRVLRQIRTARATVADRLRTAVRGGHNEPNSRHSARQYARQAIELVPEVAKAGGLPAQVEEARRLAEEARAWAEQGYPSEDAPPPAIAEVEAAPVAPAPEVPEPAGAGVPRAPRALTDIPAAGGTDAVGELAAPPVAGAVLPEATRAPVVGAVLPEATRAPVAPAVLGPALAAVVTPPASAAVVTPPASAAPEMPLVPAAVPAAGAAPAVPAAVVSFPAAAGGCAAGCGTEASWAAPPDVPGPSLLLGGGMGAAPMVSGPVTGWLDLGGAGEP